ncbi:hypothetical protein SLNWT_1901 [Streptomyces albus]|uniref:Uncharacterized protein n=1 Tax=Streptomyces albus (strain ATCC 21838 / DSM 41398 / FERM P-419 / JCM 4703 / NBRC 107858) TaxID=1081613 RepID=A0A0B5EVY1_STRA4|nr:hypothetical protein SLNWT_1901 [Streptomyces albus]
MHTSRRPASTVSIDSRPHQANAHTTGHRRKGLEGKRQEPGHPPAQGREPRSRAAPAVE